MYIVHACSKSSRDKENPDFLIKFVNVKSLFSWILYHACLLDKLNTIMHATPFFNTFRVGKLKLNFQIFQMETKLHELQEKLAIEEADKVHLQEQLNKTLDSEVIRHSHCSKSSFFVQKFNFVWFPEKKFRIVFGENSWKCYGFGLFSCWQLWFHEKNCQKKNGWKTRENVGCFVKIEFLDKNLTFRIVCLVDM